MTLEEPGGSPAERDGGEAALVADAARGSGAALATLYGRHANAVFRLGYRITGSRHDAEDVLQDVFVGLERALARYEERGRFRSWLLKVTARTAQLHVRRREVPAADPSDWASDPRARQNGSAATGGSTLAGDAEVDRIAVGEALARMPEQQRAVFLLKEVEGYRHDEIARLLHISVASSRVRLHRAWRFLHEQVGEP